MSKKQKIFLRVSSSAVLFFSVMALPWWCSLIFAVIFIFYFTRYYEVLFWALFMDAIYAAPLVRFHGIILISFGVALMILLVAEPLKRRLLFYN